MPAPTEYPTLLFRDRAHWTRWLERHHGSERGVWIRFAKKGSELKSVAYPDAVEAALCFGWIDGQVKKYDDDSWIQKFTPRGRKSVWSEINVQRVARLTAAGEMRAAGQAAVDAAKADGRWAAAYASPRMIEEPEDFLAALHRNRKATAFFATISKSNRYAILWRIHTARKPETRARRIKELVAMLARGETFH
jgi:uncharacterized protein YdeI (YjbR/CyaY-like superfamily)